MMRDAHDEARELIALGGAEELSGTQQSRLRAHLEGCAACRDYAEEAGKVVRSVRSLPVVADARLVRATQMRVRFHADRLRETRERLWLVGLACAGVGISAALSAPLIWRVFAWMGESVGIADQVWKAGFLVFCIGPALVASLLLAARGTHLEKTSDHSHKK